MNHRHPVWLVYDEYRTTRLNVKYYSSKLARARKVNLGIEIIIALSSSSAVAATWLVSTAPGERAWALLGSLAAVLAVYRVTAKTSDRLQALEQRVTSYRALEFDLQGIVREIARHGTYDAALESRFDSILDRRKNLALSYNDPPPDERLLRRCFEQVKRELPADRFPVPQGA